MIESSNYRERGRERPRDEPRTLEIHFVKADERGTILEAAKVRELDHARGGGHTRFWKAEKSKRQLVGKTDHLCKTGVADEIA
jgi:hypothetical protein